MTSLLSAAFNEVKEAARKASGRGGKHNSGIILLIDEADALAQSRELGQMHREDRAGVNALIRGVDDFATGNLPAIVVMCTNRRDSLDPAVRRRSAATFKFSRPNDAQRKAVLDATLPELGFSPQSKSSPLLLRPAPPMVALTVTPIPIWCNGCFPHCCWPPTLRSRLRLTWRKKLLRGIRPLLLFRNTLQEQNVEILVSFGATWRVAR